MAEKKSNINKENISSLRTLWRSLPANMKKFAVVVFIILICSAFFVLYYALDAVEELKFMSSQMDNLSK